MAEGSALTTPRNATTQPRKLSSLISTVVLGGGSFTHQSHPNPEKLPVRSIIEQAFARGIRTFDTSPYYGPSETLLGDAFSQPAITSKYAREDYVLMTKVGRIAATEFDYSPAWVRKSVDRSLSQLGTNYLDVVFCHDIEFVTDGDVLAAIDTLLHLMGEKKVRYIGCSGYNLERLVRIANLVKDTYGRPLDAVQAWGQLTLQNTRLEMDGLPQFRAAGVDTIFCSSPLCIGLLRGNGVPIGALGDWHPAPAGLRRVALDASNWVESQGQNLAALAIRFSLIKVIRASNATSRTALIIACSTVAELESNLRAIDMVAQSSLVCSPLLETINEACLKEDEPLFNGVRQILSSWIDYSFTSPEKEWDVQQKKMRVTSDAESSI
ncbi:Aldo/keto reductase family-domain-containing protein [Paraphoma chrysanthemicola]|nr:Aldo/keto reductase family-domain-containing protein [Paraphoma chrysanthemicola]